MCNMESISEKYIREIQSKLTEAAKYEQLAEECTELAKACLKKSRKLRNENYTPLTMDEIDSNIEEEWVDVRIAGNICSLYTNWNLWESKIKRWRDRLENY